MKTIMLLAGLMLGGCCGVPPDVVEAVRINHDTIAPEWWSYVEADPNLSAEQKARRARSMATWKEFVEKLEGDR